MKKMWINYDNCLDFEDDVLTNLIENFEKSNPKLPNKKELAKAKKIAKKDIIDEMGIED
jgi:hypothetical protein